VECGVGIRGPGQLGSCPDRQPIRSSKTVAGVVGNMVPVNMVLVYSGCPHAKESDQKLSAV